MKVDEKGRPGSKEVRGRRKEVKPTNQRRREENILFFYQKRNEPALTNQATEN